MAPAIRVIRKPISTRPRRCSAQSPYRPNDWVQTSPGDLKKAFLESNPQFPISGVSVQYGNARDRARLKELRFCYDREGAPRACGANENRQCRAKQLILPPVRG